MDNLSAVVLHVTGKGGEKQGDALNKYQEIKSRILGPSHLM